MKCGRVKCKPCKEEGGCCKEKAALEEAGWDGAGLVLQGRGWGWQEQRSQSAAIPKLSDPKAQLGAVGTAAMRRMKSCFPLSQRFYGA